MPDEAPQAPADETVDTAVEAPESAPDAPEQDTPTDDTTQPETDFEKRYNDLRSEFDRRNQIDAALRGQFGPEVQAQVANEVYGFEFESDTPDEQDETDPDEPLTRAEFEQYQQQLAQERQEIEGQQAYFSEVNDGIEKIEQEIGRDLSDEETQFILSQTDAQLRSGGQLDVAAAYKPLEAMSKRYVEQYINSKKQAQSAPLGTAGDEKIDTSDDEARKDYMAKIMQAEAARAEES